MKESNSLLNLSSQLLYKVKVKEDINSITKDIERHSYEDLIAQINTDEQKLVFWINCYNAYFQILRQVRKIDKSKIYTSKEIEVASLQLSLDDIEHGILRKNRYKYSLGFFSNPFTRTSIKKLSVKQLDYRIHFALNCGAKSCPPIAFYKLENIQDQLNLATSSFLENESIIDTEGRTITTTKLFQWYYHDFGGKKGIYRIHKEQLGVAIDGYKVKYSDYSWDEELENYME